MAKERPQKFQAETDEEYEAICQRCGICCGSEDGDPCANLDRLPDGTYFCRVYANRFGWQRTVNGHRFRCIPISAALHYPEIQERCAYVKKANSDKQGRISNYRFQISDCYPGKE